MNQARADDMVLSGEGHLVHAPGTHVISVITDHTVDAHQIREMICDKLADEAGVIVEEVRHVGSES